MSSASGSGSSGAPNNPWPAQAFQRILPPTAPTSHPQFSSLNAIMATGAADQQQTQQAQKAPAQPGRFWEAKLVVIFTFLMICEPDLDDYELAHILGSTVPDATMTGKRAFHFTEERVTTAKVEARARFKTKNKGWYKYAKSVARSDPRVPELLEVLKGCRLEVGAAKDPKFDFWMGQHHPPNFSGMCAILNQLLDKIGPPPAHDAQMLYQTQLGFGGEQGQMGFSPTGSVSSYASGSPTPRSAVPHYQAPHARSISQSQGHRRRTSSNTSGSRPQNLRQRIAASRLSSEFPGSAGSSLSNELTNDFGAMGGLGSDQAGPSSQGGGMFGGAGVHRQGHGQQQQQNFGSNRFAGSAQTAFYNPQAGSSGTAQMRQKQPNESASQGLGDAGDPGWDMYYIPNDDDFLLLDEDAEGEDE